MIYEIVELSTEAETGRTYLLVHFWLDKKKGKPYLINDFLLHPEYHEDAEGHIKEQIEFYWEQAQLHKWEGDQSAPKRFVRHGADPHGILEKTKHLVKK